MMEQKCFQCHAPITFVEEQQVTTCHFCGSQNRLQLPNPVVVISPSFVVSSLSEPSTHVSENNKSLEDFSLTENQQTPLPTTPLEDSDTSSTPEGTIVTLLLGFLGLGILVLILFALRPSKPSFSESKYDYSALSAYHTPSVPEELKFPSNHFCSVDANEDKVKDFALEATNLDSKGSPISIVDGKTGEEIRRIEKEGNSSVFCGDEHTLIMLSNQAFSFSVYDVTTGKKRFTKEISDLPQQSQIGKDCVLIQAKDETTTGFSLITGQKQECFPVTSEEKPEDSSLLFGDIKVQWEVKHPGTPFITVKGMQGENIVWQTKLPILGTEQGEVDKWLRYQDLLLLIGHKIDQSPAYLLAINGKTGTIKYEASFTTSMYLGKFLLPQSTVDPSGFMHSSVFSIDKIFEQDGYLYLMGNFQLIGVDPNTGQQLWTAKENLSLSPNKDINK